MIPAVLQPSILLALALCAAACLRRQSGAMRHAILAAGLVASMVVPFLGEVLPELQFVRGADLYRLVEDRSALLSSPVTVLNVSSVDSARVTRESHPFLWVWYGGMVIAATVLIAGASRIAWLVSQSAPYMNDKWNSALQELAPALRLKRPVRFLQNDCGVLGAWGLQRPKILLPQQAENWSEARIRVVLLHELAHIKRFDWVLQMLAELARVLYWFNPLFWILSRQLRAEAEQACDDAVLNAGVNAHDYAAELLDVARTLNKSLRPWSPVLAMSGSRQLERRFLAMLNPSLSHRSLTRTTLSVICTLAIFVTVPIASIRGAERVRQVTSPPAEPAKPSTSPNASLMKPQVQVASSSGSKKSVAPRSAPRQGLADGSLWGTVYDGTGAVVPGVIVTVANERTAEQLATSDAGNYEFRALPPGRYSLTAGFPNFMTTSIGGIEIKSGQAAHQNVTLSIGRIAERVTVSVAGQPRPPLPPGLPQRIRVGGNVQAANLISQVRPIYPQTARDAGIEGTVHMQGIIGADGSLIGLRVISSNDPDLAAAALESVRQWRYRPTLLNNVPVEVITEIDVDFKLVQ